MAFLKRFILFVCAHSRVYMLGETGRVPGVIGIVSHLILTAGDQNPSLLHTQHTVIAAGLSLQPQVPRLSLSSVEDEVQRG